MAERSEKESLKEERRKKKLRRIGKTAAWSIGIGAGLLFATFLAPYVIGQAEAQTQRAVTMLSWALVIYGGVLLGSLAFVQKYAGRINLVATYIIMPVVLLKILMDIT